MKITRRKAVAGLAAISTMAIPAGALAAADLPAEFAGRSSLQDRDQDYARAQTAYDRLQHHLLYAAMAADELSPGAGGWRLFMTGTAQEFDEQFLLLSGAMGSHTREQVVCHFERGKLKDGDGRPVRA